MRESLFFHNSMYIQPRKHLILNCEYLKVRGASRVGVLGGVQGFHSLVRRGWSSRVSVIRPRLVKGIL